MRYVVAGYVFVLIVLALYSVQLIWRRRRLVQAVDRAVGASSDAAFPGMSSSGTPSSEASESVGEVVP